MTKTEEPVDTFQQYYRQPQTLTAKESCLQYLWNSKTKEVLGRTKSGWGKHIIYLYLLFINTIIQT